jgi:hypothetical protein
MTKKQMRFNLSLSSLPLSRDLGSGSTLLEGDDGSTYVQQFFMDRP